MLLRETQQSGWEKRSCTNINSSICCRILTAKWWTTLPSARWGKRSRLNCMRSLSRDLPMSWHVEKRNCLYAWNKSKTESLRIYKANIDKIAPKWYRKRNRKLKHPKYNLLGWEAKIMSRQKKFRPKRSNLKRSTRKIQLITRKSLIVLRLSW
jgi:hypothetical protein